MVPFVFQYYTNEICIFRNILISRRVLQTQMLGTPCIAPKLKQHQSEVSLSVEKAEVDNLKNCELSIEGCSVLSQCFELNAP